MCKLKPLLERWLIDVDKESSLLNETSESYGVSSSTTQQNNHQLAQAFGKANLNGNEINSFDCNGNTSTSSNSTVSTSSSWLIGLENLGKRRKKRTSIETNVRVALEKAFLENPKPSSEDIIALAEQLFMEKEVVC